MFGPTMATLQSGATTGNGQAVQPSTTTGRKEHAFYIIGSAGIDAGAVQIETAPAAEYAGTWAALGNPVTVPASAVSIVQITGALLAVRARISTNVTNGTVTVIYLGN